MGRLAAACSASHDQDLFKLHDAVWLSTGYTKDEIACVPCVERALGRPLTVGDLDPSFPWWKVSRPVYYQGVTDGVAGTVTSAHEGESEYRKGVQFGSTLGKRSSAADVAEFLSRARAV